MFPTMRPENINRQRRMKMSNRNIYIFAVLCVAAVAGSADLRLMPVDTANFDEMRIDAASVRELYLVRAVIINKTV